MSATTSACADNQPPTAPGNVTASTRTTTSIALTWAAATDNIGVAGYGIYNGADSCKPPPAPPASSAASPATPTTHSRSTPSTASGNSSPKTTIMVSTLPCPDTTPPTQPTNLRLVSATTTERHDRLERSDRQRRRHRLRHLPRHHQGRHHHHAPATRSTGSPAEPHTRSGSEHSTRPATPPRRRPLDHHLTLRPAAASSTGAVKQTIVNGATLRGSRTGVASTTRTATAARTTPARWSS